MKNKFNQISKESIYNFVLSKTEVWEKKCIIIVSYQSRRSPGVAKWGLPPSPTTFWLLIFFMIKDNEKKLKNLKF